MAGMITDGPVEDMNFFAPAFDGNDDDIPDMPCFEVSNADDRPIAPPADDYPLGCEVELRDVEYARIAQEAAHWEPFMEEVFAVPRRRVKVCRHLGEYTFVMCADVPGLELLCLTLYRACLSEPKVKMTKYYSDLGRGAEDLEQSVQKLQGCTNQLLDEDEEDDLFSKPVNCRTPLEKTMASGQQVSGTSSSGTISRHQYHAPQRGSSGCNATTPGRTAAATTTTAAAALPEAAFGQTGAEGPFSSPDAPPFIASRQKNDDAAQGEAGASPITSDINNNNTNSSNVVSGEDKMNLSPGSGIVNNVNNIRRRNKFAIAMKRGTQEIERHNYEKALRYYNAALQEAPEEEARALSSRSVAYLLLRQTENALKDAKRVIELQPDSYLGYVRAGNVLRGMKQFNDAQCYYNEAHRCDPSNLVVRKLLMGNSVAMLYDARTKRFPRFKVVYDDAFNRVVAIARQAVRGGDVVLKESSSMFTPLGTLAHLLFGETNGATHASLHICCHCGRLILNEAQVCKEIQGLRPELFRTLYSEPHQIRCNHDCGSHYCSNECRSKAWAEHHWVECAARGRWREGIVSVVRYVDGYVRTHCPANGMSATNGGDASTSPSCIADDNSPAVVLACARVAVRMLTRMLGCVWALADAVHMYDWLQVSPSVLAQRSEAAPLLREIYRLLSNSFLGEERRTITYELYERCYERAKSNAIVLTVSAWSKIVERAESHLALVDGEDAPSYMSSHPQLPLPSAISSNTAAVTAASDKLTMVPHPPLTPSPASVAQAASLKAILAAPAEGVPGTFLKCVCLFELFAATRPLLKHAPSKRERSASPNTRNRKDGQSTLARDVSIVTAAAQPPAVSSNCVTQDTAPSYVCVHVIASSNVEKGAPLVSAAPPYSLSSCRKYEAINL